MKAFSWTAGAVVVGFVLACGGTGPAPMAECCTVDDVIRLQTEEGIDDALMIATLRTSQVDLALSADDIARLSSVGISNEVIDVLNGGPCVCEVEPEPEPVVSSAKPQPKPAALQIAIKYNGGKSMEVVNLSKRDYTGVTIVINDEYQYRLKKLKANAGDFMRFASFISKRTGAPAKRIKLQKVWIKTDQGSYSRTF